MGTAYHECVLFEILQYTSCYGFIRRIDLRKTLGLTCSLGIHPQQNKHMQSKTKPPPNFSEGNSFEGNRDEYPDSAARMAMLWPILWVGQPLVLLFLMSRSWSPPIPRSPDRFAVWRFGESAQHDLVKNCRWVNYHEICERSRRSLAKPVHLQTNKQANKKANKQSNKRTIKQSIKQTSKQKSKQAIKQTNNQTVNQTNKQTKKQTSNQTNEQSNSQSNKQTNNQATKQANKQTSKQTNKPTNERTNEQANKQWSKQTNKQANKPTNKQANKPTNQPTHPPTNQPTNQPTNERTNEQTNKQTRVKEEEEEEEEEEGEEEGGGGEGGGGEEDNEDEGEDKSRKRLPLQFFWLMFLCVPLNESVFNIVEGALQIARLCTACWKKHTLPYLAATTIHFTAILRPIEYYIDKIAGIYGALWLSNASIEQTTAIYTGIFCIFLNT